MPGSFNRLGGVGDEDRIYQEVIKSERIFRQKCVRILIMPINTIIIGNFVCSLDNFVCSLIFLRYLSRHRVIRVDQGLVSGGGIQMGSGNFFRDRRHLSGGSAAVLSPLS
jgi:hypothetical protein